MSIKSAAWSSPTHSTPPSPPNSGSVPVLLWGAASTASVALMAVSWPLNTTLYGIALLPALLLSLALAATPVLALSSPRVASALAAAAVVVLAAFSSPATGSPWPVAVSTTIAFAAALGLAAARSGWRAPAAAWLIAVAGASIVGGLGIHPPASSGAVTADLIVFAAVSGAAVLGGLVISRWQDVRAQLVREQRLSASEQARREVAEERTRIARELHDVVAHGMSAIQVQASSARYRLQGLSEEAAEEFDDLAATARSAMGEMRLLLGVLRSDSSTAETAPQPGVREVPALVAAAGGLGEVRLADELSTARAAGLDPVLSLAVYRIVQESLSNVARHATGADTTVRLRSDDGVIVVEVANGAAPGRPAEAPAPVAGGHGIRGMRERAELLGGSLEAAAVEEGGFRVLARLPLPAEDAA